MISPSSLGMDRMYQVDLGCVQCRTLKDVVLSKSKSIRRLTRLYPSKKGSRRISFGNGSNGHLVHPPKVSSHKLEEPAPSKNEAIHGLEVKIDFHQIWNPLEVRRVSVVAESSTPVGSVSRCVVQAKSDLCLAAISAQTYELPSRARAGPRSKRAIYLAGGIFLSLAASIWWFIIKTEQYARKSLVTPEDTVLTPPPPDMVEQYERAKASVSQAALVKAALAAIRSNDYIKATVEMELALEENRLARSSVESDFFEDGEVYRGVVKMWSDGYPLDYGKVLQLRGLLDVASKVAESIEQEVQQQSDAYVI